jgi:hypothetical protein
VHKKVLNELLKPRTWKAGDDRRFLLNADEIGELCDNAEKIFRDEPTVLQVGSAGGRWACSRGRCQGGGAAPGLRLAWGAPSCTQLVAAPPCHACPPPPRAAQSAHQALRRPARPVRRPDAAV